MKTALTGRARRAALVVTAAAVALGGVAALAGNPTASADLTPTTATITINPGASATENKTVTIPALPQNADIVVAIDTTGSMGFAIDQAKANASALVGAVQSSIPSANFAVVQFKDSGDTPEYDVVQPNTSNVVSVQAAIDTLSASGGGDYPEAQNLVFQNAAIDGAPLWRTNTKRFLVVITDAPPHVPTYPACSDFSSADPHGLDTATQIAALNADSTTLFAITVDNFGTVASDCYAEVVAAAYPGSAQAPLGSDLSAQIVALISAASASVNDIHLEVVAPNPNASWITFSPTSVGPVATPAEANFVLTATVPAGTPGGTYLFDIVALADGGDVGHQALTIIVPATPTCVAQTNLFDQPINNDGSSNFKLGSTIPVKVRITCDGAPLAGVSPDVDLVRIDTSPEGDVNEVISSSAADTGDNMRAADGKYIFNLSTKRSQFNAGSDLAVGTYKLTVDDSDSATPAFAPFSVVFDLRK